MDTTTPTLLLELIEHAESGEHIKFNLITTWEDYLNVYSRLSAQASILKALRKGSKKLFKSYCKAVKKQESDVTMLLVKQALDDTCKFYEEEYNTLHSMLDEYEIYLLAGNLMNFGIRPEELLWDHREAEQWNNH